MREENGALFCDEPVFAADPAVVAMIKQRALASPQRGARLYLHRDNGQPMLEALVAATPAATRPPHCHADRYETHVFLEGRATAFLFDDQGALTRRVELGPPGRDTPCCLSAGPGEWHMIAFRAEMTVYYEVTPGPYTGPGMVRWADWAPAPDDVDGVAQFLKRLEAP